MFTKVSQESEAAVHASYVLSEMIAKHSKPFTEGDFIKECLIKAAEIVCPGSVKTFQAISLSRNTVVERVTDMARNLNDQIKEKSSCFEAFSIACDESTDIGGVAQLAVFFFRACDTDFNIFEELLELVPMHGTTTGEDIFNCVYDLLQKYNLPQSKLTSVATDGAPSMTGKTYGFVALRWQVRWLSCSKVLKQFWNLKEEICQFLITKNQDITLFSDQVWLQEFSFMVDITKHLSDLNLKLQGKDQIITNMCDQVNAFKCKLVLWEKQLKNEDLMHFPTCNMYKSSLGETASYQKYAEKILSLRNEFETRFSDFKSLEGKFTLFSSIFSINIESAPNHMQMVVIDIQCDSDLKAKFIEVGVSEFYKYLPARFENTRKLAYEIMYMFGSTYRCEQLFSLMKGNKSPIRSRITDVHLESMTVRQIEETLGIPKTTVDRIMREHLGLRKLSARWVPKLLTPIKRLVQATIHAMETLRFPSPQKAKTVPTAGKVMVSVFWDSEGVLLLDFLNKGQTITGDYYANLVKQLREAIKEKRRGKLSRKIVYHQDNAPSQRSLQAMATIYDSGFELLPHAPYSPDLARLTSTYFLI
ncbi:hypothetical protein LAZ67_12001195 [Cordylochernes scorpioides]|uniref:Transposase n=1 Tax=Cordylochernes scorpioides TaxID=51811 RepID=A0ABY6L105_9ARAC|nr:hypothetical protein LAZ67_12001195 [Cordylochernes scorpioides]